jgi:DNA-binding response OmpR family regulator
VATSARVLEAVGRPATPTELLREVAPDQPVLLVGSSAVWDSTGVVGWMEANGWSWTSAEGPERARWLASIQRISLVLVAGDEATVWSVVNATRPVTMAPLVVLANPSAHGVVALVGAGVDGVMDPSGGAEEVFARVVALLRRSDHGWGSGVRYLRSSGLLVDLWSQECDLDGRRLHLSPTEYALLTFLMTHPQRALATYTIVRRVWSWGPSDSKNTLRIFVNRLRRKLGDDPRDPRFIASVRGTGYRFIRNVAEMGDEAEPAVEGTDVAPLLEAVEELATGLLGCDGSAAAECLLETLDATGYADGMALFRVVGRQMRLVGARNMPADWMAGVEAGVPLKPSFASAQSVLGREVVQVGDIGQMAESYGASAGLLAAAGHHACLFLPILCGDRVWGHLGLCRRARQPFDPVGTSFVRAACAVFALTVDDI